MTLMQWIMRLAGCSAVLVSAWWFLVVLFSVA